MIYCFLLFSPVREICFIIFILSFLLGVLVVFRTSPPIFSSSPPLLLPRCTRLQMFNIFFCDCTEPKPTTDSSRCCTSAPPSYSLIPQPCFSPQQPSATCPHPPLIVSDLLQPVAFPTSPILPSSHLCVSVVLIWTLMLLLPPILSVDRETHTQTNKQKRHTFIRHMHDTHTHIQYIPKMPA